MFFWQELVRQVLSAIRAVSGNDDVKDAVVNSGGVQLIVIAMNRHMNNPAVSWMSYLLIDCEWDLEYWLFSFIFVG